MGIGIGMPGREHRHQPAGLPAAGARAELSRLLRAAACRANFFFYDGLYWVLEGDNWYASSWYNGPWGAVAPAVVPVFLLRVPVRYYRSPPTYFRGWRPDAPPRWGEHWGNSWEQRPPTAGTAGTARRRRRGPLRLPVYQRKFPHERYPQPAQQPSLHGQNYRYQPREPVVRQHYQEQIRPATPGQGRQPDRKPGPGQGRDKDDKPGHGSK